MLASVIVVNLNKRQLTLQCLESLARQDCGDYEVILVDNNSSDDTVEAVGRAFPAVRIIELETNKGFACAVNEGIRQSRGELVATLNNDAVAEPRWLPELVSGAQARPRTGMVASKMLFFDTPEVINSAGICLDRVGIAWDRLGGHPDTEREGGLSTEVFGPCAGAALYKRSMLEDVGLFDEDFFLYLEDVDMAWRAQARGWNCVYVPSARVYHVHSASAEEGSVFKRFLLGRNKVWLIIKNYPNPQLVYWLPLIVMYDLAAACYGAVKKKDLVSLRGRLAALAQLRRFLGKRHDVQKLKQIELTGMRHLLAPTVLPWRVTDRYRHLGTNRVRVGEPQPS